MGFTTPLTIRCSSKTLRPTLRNVLMHLFDRVVRKQIIITTTHFAGFTELAGEFQESEQ